MQILRDQRRLRKAADPCGDLFLERVEHVWPSARRQFRKGWMQAQQVIDRSTECRLTAVDKPLTTGERAEMGPPNPVDEPRPAGQRHAARGRAQNQSQTPA